MKYKQWLDYVPLVLFGLTYVWWGIYVATAVLMISITLVWVGEMIAFRRFFWGQGGLVLAVLVFGGLTLYFQATWFLKLKVSIVETVIGVVFLISYWTKKPLLNRLISDPKINARALSLLTRNYGFFSLGLAVLNAILWFWAPTSLWVLFKSVGTIVLNIAFFLLHAPTLARTARRE